MRPSTFNIFAIAAIALAASAPTIASAQDGQPSPGYSGQYPDGTYAIPAAPAPISEAVPNLPPGYSWQPGHWAWSASQVSWQWSAGYALAPSEPSYVPRVYYGPSGTTYYGDDAALGLELGFGAWAFDGPGYYGPGYGYGYNHPHFSGSGSNGGSGHGGGGSTGRGGGTPPSPRGGDSGSNVGHSGGIGNPHH